MSCGAIRIGGETHLERESDAPIEVVRHSVSVRNAMALFIIGKGDAYEHNK